MLYQRTSATPKECLQLSRRAVEQLDCTAPSFRSSIYINRICLIACSVLCCVVPFWVFVCLFRSANKSLARTGRKQAHVSVRMAWISFGALPCRKNNLMTARVSVLLKSRAPLTCFRACFLPGRAKDLSARQVYVWRTWCSRRFRKWSFRCSVGTQINKKGTAMNQTAVVVWRLQTHCHQPTPQHSVSHWISFSYL